MEILVFAFGVTLTVALYEHAARKKAEKGLRTAEDRNRGLCASLCARDVQQAYGRGLEDGRQTDALYKRMLKNVEQGRGTVILRGEQYNLRDYQKCGDGHGN